MKFHKAVVFGGISILAIGVGVGQTKSVWKAPILEMRHWATVLADDKAGTDQWVEASQRITDPANVTRENEYTYRVDHRKPTMPLHGDVLRSQKHPSISQLLDRRARQIARVNGGKANSNAMDLQKGMEMALRLSGWERKAALPTLQAVSRRVMDVTDRPHEAIFLGMLSEGLSRATILRVHMGDKKALGEHVAWLEKIELDHLSPFTGRAFQPLSEFRTKPEVLAAAQHLFGPGSQWNIVRLCRADSIGPTAQGIVLSPLLDFKPVRLEAEQVLGMRQVIGETSVDKSGGITMNSGTSSYGYGGGSGSATTVSSSSSEGHGAGAKTSAGSERRPLRLCDSIAQTLSRLKGAPTFEPYWPEARKDKAIAQLSRYLEVNAARLDSLVPWPNNWKALDPRMPVMSPAN